MSEKVCAIMIEKVCANCYFKGKTQEDYPPARCGSCIDYCWWTPKDYKPTDYRVIVEDEKSDNQNAKADAGKLDPTLVPRKIIWDIAVIRRYGVKKYKEPDNWKRVSAERYRSAAFRHFLAYLDDPKGVDDESGYPHLWHLATNIAFLCEMEE